MVRTPDPFKPSVDAVYTNGEVNRLASSYGSSTRSLR